MTINWNFIAALEGNVLEGYVPCANGVPLDHSGVTIGCGVDIGQCSVSDIANWGLADAALQRLLQSYAGLRGQAALDKLFGEPLRISGAQSAVINAHGQRHNYDMLKARFDHAVASPSALSAFDTLPDEAQTVLMSVQWEYGDLADKCPKFWAAFVAHDWSAVVAELEDFHDHFHSRRMKEAAYLAPLLPKTDAPVGEPTATG